MVRRGWVATWTGTGDAYCRLADLNINKKEFDEATEAWLCALTAFEVARRLVRDDDPRSADVSAKVEAGVRRIGVSFGREVESVRIACDDLGEIGGYYLAAGAPNPPAPAVICVSSEEEKAATLLGRLLPVMVGHSMSVLVISHAEVANRARGESEVVLSHCLDHLSARSDVDSSRIGVYGDGLSASLATGFAAYDRRVAAAVCDGGIWNWTRSLKSIGWMTSTDDGADNEMLSAYRSRLARLLNCPILVVAGGRGVVSVSEAIKLQAVCVAARIDVDLLMPQLIRGCQGEAIDNFVSSDDCIFRWLAQRLSQNSTCDESSERAPSHYLSLPIS
ncbi:alpha/beta hydrolase [Bradyrhizobium sp. Rc3b]|uniref:alpha/beta hydrolase family protein n=1 Tax=Bradyrhizobium sp. Rc3b TaxID=1855322 RepID=UPI00116086C8|nr:alpha/beta hydrolase [Bradyrhizobium sp. Rc3b]